MTASRVRSYAKHQETRAKSRNEIHGTGARENPAKNQRGPANYRGEKEICRRARNESAAARRGFYRV